jgi:hypothetical protein
MFDFDSGLRGDSPDIASALSERDAICLYALARRCHAPDFPAPECEERLRLHGIGSIAAVIGIVPIAEYCGVGSERNLADVAWLAPRVRRHAELVNWTMQWSPVFPAPFGAFFKSFGSLTEFMRAHQQTIAAFLERVADKDEWELRGAARFDSPDQLDRLACKARPEWRGLPKGVRYMRLCRDREALLNFGRAEAAAVVRDHVAELRSLTAAVSELAPGRNTDPNAGEPIARYALLVDRANSGKLREAVRAIGSSAEPVAVVLSGPLPPFSFRPDLVARN